MLIGFDWFVASCELESKIILGQLWIDEDDDLEWFLCELVSAWWALTSRLRALLPALVAGLKALPTAEEKFWGFFFEAGLFTAALFSVFACILPGVPRKFLGVSS